ncbi:MAG: molybdopterin-guanine dinucleotide biosynthesis protein B [Bosea sp.]|jgi:molybdopterin-guanine dinucleotide biosynthesis protein B|nr:molybdopterin-guanine dinucleotide biosynthesis protein B [Bosea sp. (in: a-proteobacteria)]
MPAVSFPAGAARRKGKHVTTRIIGLAGWSGAGKTTLLGRLIPHLVARGLKVSTLKHAHHAFDVDHPGKDSHDHRLAGASEVLVSSGRRWALMHELRDEPEARLVELLPRLSPVDLVIVEGFKRERHRMFEVHRTANGKPPLHPDNPGIVAIASDAPFPAAGRPVVGLDDIEAIAAMALAFAEPIDEVLARLNHSAEAHGPAHR